jgi:hypothetical protein
MRDGLASKYYGGAKILIQFNKDYMRDVNDAGVDSSMRQMVARVVGRQL